MSYDPKVFELGWDFILAGERYRVLDHQRVPAPERHLMCGLFKQSTFGDIDIKFGAAQGDVLANCHAWQSQKGLSRADAIRKYVAKADQLVAAYGSH